MTCGGQCRVQACARPHQPGLLFLRPMYRASTGEISGLWESQEIALLTYSVVHSFIRQQWVESFGELSSGLSTRRDPVSS